MGFGRSRATYRRGPFDDEPMNRHPARRTGRLIAIGGLLVIAAAALPGFAAAAAGDASPDAWVQIGTSMFTAAAAGLLAFGIANGAGLAMLTAGPFAALLVIGAVTNGLTDGMAGLATLVGALLALAGLAVAVLLDTDSPPIGRGRPSRESVVIGILILHVAAMLARLAGFATLSMVGGLIGFSEYWTVPVDAAILMGLVIAGVTLQWRSAISRAMVALTLAASGAAYLTSFTSDDGVGALVFKAVIVVTAGVGIALAALEPPVTAARGENP